MYRWQCTKSSILDTIPFIRSVFAQYFPYIRIYNPLEVFLRNVVIASCLLGRSISLIQIAESTFTEWVVEYVKGPTSRV